MVVSCCASIGSQRECGGSLTCAAACGACFEYRKAEWGCIDCVGWEADASDSTAKLGLGFCLPPSSTLELHRAQDSLPGGSWSRSATGGELKRLLDWSLESPSPLEWGVEVW